MANKLKRERGISFQKDNTQESNQYMFPDSAENSDKNKGNQRVVASVEHFSGPIPPPSLIAEYEKMIPGFGEKLLNLTIEQSRFRMSLEDRMINNNSRKEARAQWFSFILFFVTVLGGIYIISIGKSAVGLSTLVAGLGTALGIFFFGKDKARTELESKKNPKFPTKQQ